MGLIDFLVTKLLGYDVLEEKEKLEASLENAQRSISSLTQQNKTLNTTVRANKREISHLSNTINQKVIENDELCASLDAKEMGLKQLTDALNSQDQEIAVLRESESNLKASLNKGQRAITSLTRRNKELQDSVDVSESQICQLSNQIEEQVSKNARLSEVVSDKEAEIEQLTNTVGSKDEQIKDLSAKVEKLDAQRRSQQGTIMNHVKKINALSAELEELQQQAEQHNLEHDELEQLKDNYASLCDAKKDLEGKCAEVQNENNDLQINNKNLVDQIASLEKEIANTPKVKPEDIRELESQIQKNEEIIQTKVREIERLNSEKDDLKSQFDDVCKELENVRNEKDENSERLTELENQNNALQEKFDALNNDYEALQQKLNALECQKKEEPVIEVGEPANVPVTETVKPVQETVKQGETEKQSFEPNTFNGNPKGQTEKEEEVTPAKKKTVVKKPKDKTKEQEIIEQSGGCIENFPLIVNDSNKKTQRTIEYVFDDNNKIVYADEFFERSAEEIAQVSRKMSEAEISGQPYWSCALCHHRVKIAHRSYKSKESLFFIHATRDHYCPWLTKATKSDDAIKDEDVLLATDDLQEETLDVVMPKARELKEKIYSLLTSQTSIDAGVSDVKMDETIHSKVPYMRWRRPDISFTFNGRRMVIELQKKSHDIDTIVDRDIFFRLNDIQILWIFGSDSDSSYDYMRKLNYKNTMFDNHRNVFVFDKEAQSASDEKGTLLLKCNWLNDDDAWHFMIENSGTNGKMVRLNELTFDDEYCKPYYFDANEEYFSKNPDAREAYFAKKMTREELIKSIEEKWTRDSNYEEAQAQMRQRNSKATIFSIKGLWGFRFNTTIIIPPIFTVEPKDLYNGYYLVQQGSNFGIVNYYGEKVVRWDGLIPCEGMNYDRLNKLLHFKRNGLWGIADLLGNELIPPTYQAIAFWTNTIYRVQKNSKWGLCNTNNEQICDFVYNKIESVVNGRAQVLKNHPTKIWMNVTGYIDLNGKEIYTTRSKQEDGLYIVQKFELWGIVDEDAVVIIPCQYEEIAPWAEHLYKIKQNSKWGIYDVEKQEFLLETKYELIGNIIDGVAKTVFAKTESAIDVTGQEVAQVVVQLQNGFKKTLVAGKWGIVDENGKVIVNHQYDEIGSFRSRMIGVINGRIIKLDANYEYPIYISGKYIEKNEKSHIFNIAGVKCTMPEGLLRQARKTIAEICDSQNVCKQLAFTNLIFSTQTYCLRVLRQGQLKKKLTHSDGKTDFPVGEILNAKITSFKMGKGGKKKALVKFPDGMKSMVPRRFFKSSHPIAEYKIGDTLLLKKIGFDDEFDQTIWEVQ